MTDRDTDKERLLAAARQLVQCLEQDDESGAESAIEDLTRIRERELFQELGLLTRELHDALKAFKSDTRLAAIAEEIPDAQDRLNYVIDMTEQSAHRTLNAVEQSLNLVNSLAEDGAGIRDRWQQFRRRELSAEDFRTLSRDLETFLEQLGEQGTQLQSHLTDALMAQDYQDLTGQIIRRVINLVQEVETGMVSLISLSGRRITEERPDAADNRKSRDSADPAGLEGPQVPGMESSSAVSGQDEVDDLLSSLGF